VIFFEGARITLEAHIAEYPPSTTTSCARCSRSATRGSPIASIVLTSSTDTIDKHIRLRNRPHERRTTWCGGSG
jgi:hypothetical protein